MIIRKMDKLGRVDPPKAMREAFEMHPGDWIEIVPTDTGIELRKYHDRCIFTGQTKNLFEYNGIKFCYNAIKEIVSMINKEN